MIFNYSPSNSTRWNILYPFSSRFFLPPTSGRSTIKAISTTTPPSCSTSFAAAIAVPPVARRSSITRTLSPFFIASVCISRVFAPYSSSYSYERDSDGSFPGFEQE